MRPDAAPLMCSSRVFLSLGLSPQGLVTPRGPTPLVPQHLLSPSLESLHLRVFNRCLSPGRRGGCPVSGPHQALDPCTPGNLAPIPPLNLEHNIRELFLHHFLGFLCSTRHCTILVQCLAQGTLSWNLLCSSTHFCHSGPSRSTLSRQLPAPSIRTMGSSRDGSVVNKPD